MDAKASLCRFLGYAEHLKSYRFEDISSGRVTVIRDAQFMEDVFDGGRSVQEQAVTDLNEEASTDNEDTDDAMNEDEDVEDTQTADFAPGDKRHPRTQSLC